jgi:L-alanine-DL-glutamate epimerase-like enolase superfamily enzyme
MAVAAAAFSAHASSLPLLAAQSVPAGKPPRLRITNIESFAVKVPAGEYPPDPLKLYRYGVTRVHTNEGITGTSFIAVPPNVLESWVKPALMGEDLFAVDRHLERLQTMRGIAAEQTWSGVEHAIWDAIGRAVKLPVAKILGGYRDRLQVYRTAVFPGDRNQSNVPYELPANFALRLKKAGYTAIKVQVWRRRPMDDVDMIGVMRQAVGNDFKIMADRTAVLPGWVWDYQTALRVARGLEKHRTYWLEEPFDGYDVNGPARLAAEVDIFITGGELGNSLYRFLLWIMNKSYDIIQPDTRICGGIWIARKVSILAEAFGIPCIQHGINGLALAGYIQAGCAMPNCEWQEMVGIGANLPEEEWQPALKLLNTPHAFRIENGTVYLSDLPGLGLDINEDAFKEYRVDAA